MVVYYTHCNALTGKVWMLCIGGRLWEVVPYETRSHMEVRLYFKIVIYQKLKFIERITCLIPR